MPTPGLNDKYIIIARDEFSSWPEAISVPNISGAIVAKFLYESFITRYGYFTTLKTDGGPEFCNQVITTLVETYGIKHILGTPHYPQSHGFIERQHQGIINFLKITKHQPLVSPPIHRPLGRSHTSQIHD